MAAKMPIETAFIVKSGGRKIRKLGKSIYGRSGFMFLGPRW